MKQTPRMSAAALATAAILCPVAAQADDRIIGLKGRPTFRDIGGYATSDSRKIKSGLVCRSGELPKLTDEDVETLRELGIKTVVNFLTFGEIEYRGKDRLPEGVRQINLPLTGEIAGIPDAANKLVEARKSGDFRKFPPEFNPLVHEELVSGIADQQYSGLFKILADESNYPLVYHCSHGVHRTGTAAALVLSALGVPWETGARTTSYRTLHGDRRSATASINLKAKRPRFPCRMTNAKRTPRPFTPSMCCSRNTLMSLATQQ